MSATIRPVAPASRLLGPVHVNGVDLSVVVSAATPPAVALAILRSMILDYARRS